MVPVQPRPPHRPRTGPTCHALNSRRWRRRHRRRRRLLLLLPDKPRKFLSLPMRSLSLLFLLKEAMAHPRPNVHIIPTPVKLQLQDKAFITLSLSLFSLGALVPDSAAANAHLMDPIHHLLQLREEGHLLLHIFGPFGW